MHKNKVVECVNSHIKKLLNSSNSDLKFRIVASQGRIHMEEGYKIEIKRFFGIFGFRKQR